MNWDHRPVCVLITGKKGSGKTTFWLAALARHRARWKFVFDPTQEVSRKLHLAAAVDLPTLNRATTAGGIVCFDSSPLFPGDRRTGFAFFSRYVFNVSKVLHGVKLFAADELQSCQRPGGAGMPQGLKEITDEGRREEIDCIFSAQRLNEINDDVRAQITEIITFKHDDPLALRWLTDRGFDAGAVAALPAPGGWIARTDDGRITTYERHPGYTPPSHTPGTTDRRPAFALRQPEGNRRPTQNRSSDGRFSPGKFAPETSRPLHR